MDVSGPFTLLQAALMLLMTSLSQSIDLLSLTPESLGVDCTESEIIGLAFACIIDKYVPSDFLEDCQPQCQNADALVQCINGRPNNNRDCLLSLNKVLRNTPEAWGPLLLDAAESTECNFTFTNLIDVCPDISPFIFKAWTEWQNGTCSVTRGDGVLPQTRECYNSASGDQETVTGCHGNSTDVIPCYVAYTDTSGGKSCWDHSPTFLIVASIFTLLRL